MNKIKIIKSFSGKNVKSEVQQDRLNLAIEAGWAILEEPTMLPETQKAVEQTMFQSDVILPETEINNETQKRKAGRKAKNHG